MQIVIAGGGPAGVAAASRLAVLGHDVTLLARRRQNFAVEGISFRVLEGFRAAGLSGVIEHLPGPVERHSFWNDEERTTGEEWLAERNVFDKQLASAARRFANIRDARFIAATPKDGTVEATIEATNGRRSSLRADFLIDARGRGAPGGGRRIAGPNALALCRRYKSKSKLPPSTWLETCAKGWAWLAVPHNGQAYLQISIAGERGSLPGRAALEAHFETLLHDFPGMRERLRGSEGIGAVFARPAGASVCSAPVQERMLRVGDAAMTIDSLSGHGVFEAIAGAFAAAATVNTILRHPSDGELARRFYTERTISTFWTRTRSGQVHYRGEERWPGSPFWDTRREWPEADMETAPAQSKIVRRAVIDEGWIRECEVIVTPEQPRGVWRLDGVPVVPLWKLLRRGEVADPQSVAKALGVPVGAAASAIVWLGRINLPEPNPLH